MRLYHNDKLYEVKITQILTGKLKKDLLELMRNKPLDSIQLRFQEVFSTIDETDSTKMAVKIYKSGKFTPEEIARFNSDAYVPGEEEETDLFYINFLRKIIDIKSVKEEIQKFIIEYDNDFWDNQDINAIRNEVDSFRVRMGLKGKTDNVNSEKQSNISNIKDV